MNGSIQTAHAEQKAEEARSYGACTRESPDQRPAAKGEGKNPLLGESLPRGRTRVTREGKTG